MNWWLLGQAAPTGSPLDRYVTLGSALGVAIAATWVVIRMQRWSIADLREDREADRRRIDELEAERDDANERARASGEDARAAWRRVWDLERDRARLHGLVRDLGGDPGP